jgi:ABC-type branched-subunit amino acid transport system substrate-binding protein
MATAGKNVFVSYAADDRKMAQRVTRLLDAAGVDVFVDRRDCASGDMWQDAVLADIRSSDALVFLIPRREGVGKWALAEIGAAKALGKRIVAILPESVRYGNADVGSVLSNRQIIDASDMSDEALTSSLVSVLG